MSEYALAVVIASVIGGVIGTAVGVIDNRRERGVWTLVLPRIRRRR